MRFRNGCHWFARFCGALCCGLYFVQLNTAYAIMSPKQVDVYKKDLQGFKLLTHYYIESQNVPTGSTIPKNKQLAVVYPKNRVLDLAKKAKKFSPVGIVLNAAVGSAGWAIDELTAQITTPGGGPAEGYEEGYYWWVGVTSPNADGSGATAEAAAKKLAASSSDFLFNRMEGDTAVFDYSGGWEISASPSKWSCTINQSICDTMEIPDAGGEEIPVAVQEDAIVPKLLRMPNFQLEEMLKDAFDNPLTTQEVIDQINDWGQSMADADPALEWDPNTRKFTYTDPTTGTPTEYDTGVSNNEDSDRTSSNRSSASSGTETDGTELPAFCTWASIVCDWYTWSTQDPEIPDVPELPLEELSAADFEQSYSTGLSGGSCPADRTLPAFHGGQNVTYSFAIPCEVATDYFKPILLFLAALSAAYILAGKRES